MGWECFPQELCRESPKLLPRAQELQIQTGSKVDFSLALTRRATRLGLATIWPYRISLHLSNYLY